MSSSLEQIHADAILEPDLHPSPGNAASTSGTVLITGATGFLGRYVLARLLRQTDQHLILLVRSKPDQTASQRIGMILAEIGIDLGQYPNRVRIFEGDVAQDLFGLDPATYEIFTHSVATIYHCSATVDWVRDYGGLRKVNVEGVRNMIRFACTANRKRIVFSSSIAVCMFNTPRVEMSEYTPVFPHIADMPLGYARSKAVAEALLLQCAERGVPVTVVRPPLISGHSQSGHSNPTDIFAALLQACIVTGKGPDTDWTFDIMPVDYVAQVLTDVPQNGQNWQVLNLKQQNAHAWTHLLTWINLHGYRVERIATDDWIQYLFGDARARGQMLYTQRQYFAGRPPRSGETNWIRPFEAYLAKSYATVNGDRTADLLDGLGIAAPEIDIDTLHAYFRDFRRTGVLPERGDRAGDEDYPYQSGSEMSLAAFLEFNEARRIGKQSGIMNQLAASEVRLSAGVWLLNGNSDDARRANNQTVIKLTPYRGVLRDQSAALASAVSPELGELFRRYDDPFELAHCGMRERAIYQAPPEGLAQFMPRVSLKGELGALEHIGLLMEYLPEADVEAHGSWLRSTDADFAHVIQGMASVHAIGFRHKQKLAEQIRPVVTPSGSRMLQMRPLWAELAEVAAPIFVRYGGKDANAMHQRVVQSLADWWPMYEALPRTLIHNDFNPRNFIMRRTIGPPRLCLYDWEIVAIGPPQRDLAELLCFTWTAGAGLNHLKDTLRQSHDMLEAQTGHNTSHKNWCHGFHLAMQYFIISRLPLYTLINHLSAVPFLPRLIENSVEILALAQSLQDRIEA